MSVTQILAIFSESCFKSAAIYFHRKNFFWSMVFYTVINIQFTYICTYLRNGKRAECNYRVMVASGRLLSTKEAYEAITWVRTLASRVLRKPRGDSRVRTLASRVLRKPLECIHNSIVAHCMLTISFITLRLFKKFYYWSRMLTWSQKHDKPRENVNNQAKRDLLVLKSKMADFFARCEDTWLTH